MDRAKFIKTLGCAIIGAPLAMSLLNSCESIYYAQTKQVDGKYIVKKSEFIQTKAKGTSFRNFVLINKGVGGYPICLYRNGEDDYTADRKSTRLNSSHVAISYAVFCLKKKKYIEN